MFLKHLDDSLVLALQQGRGVEHIRLKTDITFYLQMAQLLLLAKDLALLDFVALKLYYSGKAYLKP